MQCRQTAQVLPLNGQQGMDAKRSQTYECQRQLFGELHDMFLDAIPQRRSASKYILKRISLWISTIPGLTFSSPSSVTN